MAIPLHQVVRVGTYLVKQHLSGNKRYPLVLMLEPLFRCNLACAGCGKIDYPAEILNQRLSVEQCMEAVEECGAPVVEHGSNYVCSKSVPTLAQATPSCDFKSGQIILQQPIERAQMEKLLATGKTDMLEKFVSMRTRRAFKAMLAWDAEAGKVNFEFEPSKFPRKTPARPAAKVAADAVAGMLGG